MKSLKIRGVVRKTVLKKEKPPKVKNLGRLDVCPKSVILMASLNDSESRY